MDRDFHQRNLEAIEKLKEKKQKEVEEKQSKQLRQLQIKNKLKVKILNEAAQKKEERQRQLEQAYLDEVKCQQQQHLGPRQASDFNEVENNTSSQKQIQSAQGKQNVFFCLDFHNDENEEKKESRKMNNYFRSRYVTFINTLHEAKKGKEKQEELQKEKEARKIQKLREQIGLTNVQSKLNETLQLGSLKSKEKKSELQQQEEEDKNEKLIRDANIRILEKQKLLILS